MKVGRASTLEEKGIKNTYITAKSMKRGYNLNITRTLMLEASRFTYSITNHVRPRINIMYIKREFVSKKCLRA